MSQTREEIRAEMLRPRAAKTVCVPLTTLGEPTDRLIRPWSGGELEQYYAQGYDDKGRKRVPSWRALMARMSLCDESGVLLFGPEDDAAIAAWPAAVLVAICDAARKLNGMDEEARDEAKNS